MTVVLAFLILVVVFLAVIGIRTKDLPEPEPTSPTAHLEERKARIYEGLRDLQFEYRVGKLSDEDYQRTKLDLQRELASVLAEIDRLNGTASAPAASQPASAPAPAASPAPAARPIEPNVCPHCGARFPVELKFCGQCGKPMSEVVA